MQRLSPQGQRLDLAMTAVLEYLQGSEFAQDRSLLGPADEAAGEQALDEGLVAHHLSGHLRCVKATLSTLLQRHQQLDQARRLVSPAGAMTECAYQLHALLMHDGPAGQGHYFTYIRETDTDRWLLFNDSTVTAVDAEVVQNKVSGKCAGCAVSTMVYARPYVLQKGAQMEVPTILRTEVEADNDVFAEEMELWQQRTTQNTNSLILSEDLPQPWPETHGGLDSSAADSGPLSVEGMGVKVTKASSLASMPLITAAPACILVNTDGGFAPR